MRVVYTKYCAFYVFSDLDSIFSFVKGSGKPEPFTVFVILGRTLLPSILPQRSLFCLDVDMFAFRLRFGCFRQFYFQYTTFESSIDFVLINIPGQRN